MQFNVSATLLVKLLTKLALIENQENRTKAQVEFIEQATGEKGPVCHCPSCLMPDLAKELNAEIDDQLQEGAMIDDFADPAEIERITEGLVQYVMEREELLAQDAIKSMTGKETVN
jgi:hypothetical protein